MFYIKAQFFLGKGLRFSLCGDVFESILKFDFLLQ